MKAYELQQERIDHNNYTLGLYVYSAFGAVIGAAFGNKKAQYVDEPFTVSAKKRKEMENMDEETKMKYVRQLFGQLGTMQKNFEADKKRKVEQEKQKTS